MRGPIVTMLAIFAALCAVATVTHRLFLSRVKPIADDQVLRSMGVFDAAFLVRSLENVALLGVAAIALIVPLSWMRTAGFRRPGA